MSLWVAPLSVSLVLSWTVHPSHAAPGCRFKNGQLRTPPGVLHSDAGDFSGWSPEDSWSWPDSRGPPTRIGLPDGREFWPSDSRSVQDPRELGFEPVDAKPIARMYKRLWDEYRDYEEKNATQGRRMKMIDHHYDLLHNQELPIEEKAELFAKDAGSVFQAEKRTLSGESVADRPGDVEKLSNLMLKALKIHKKWYGHYYTDQPWKARGFTTKNLDVNDMYSRYYAQVNYTTRSSFEDIAYEEAFFRTMTEFTTFVPMDVDWWIKAADFMSRHPNVTSSVDYLEEAFQAWSRFTHPTTEHVSHRTINLTVFFDRQYTKNDTFDYFSLDQFKPKGWTEPMDCEPAINPYELKDVVIARYRNTSTKVLPRANFFYSTYESEYDYNNSYSELNNLDFGHFQGESSEIVSIRETPKTYPPHVVTCPHGFPRDPTYDVSDDVSDYESMRVHITTERATTAPITHNMGFRYDMIETGTTGTVDMDVLLGRNTHRRHKRSTTTTTRSRRSRKTTKAKQTLETCLHGLEITNDRQDIEVLRGVFERIRVVNQTVRACTYKKRSTRFTTAKRNVTRTRKTRKPRVTTAGHVLKKRDVGKAKEMKIGGNGEAFDGKLDAKSRILGTLKGVFDDTRRRRGKRAMPAVESRLTNGLGRRFAAAALVDESHQKRFAFSIETLGGGKRRKRCPGSEMEYVSKNAKDKAYRSYEDYLKKTKHECNEDRICRLFKEELAREDSFDGLGHWN